MNLRVWPVPLIFGEEYQTEHVGILVVPLPHVDLVAQAQVEQAQELKLTV